VCLVTCGTQLYFKLFRAVTMMYDSLTVFLFRTLSIV